MESIPPAADAAPVESPTPAPAPAPRRWSPRRLLAWATLTIVLLALVIGTVVYLNLNRILKQTIEQQSKRSLNLDTAVNSAHLSLTGGKLTVDDYRIASPPGFSAEPLLVLQRMDVSVGSYGELRHKPVRLSNVEFHRPRLLIELAGGSLNIKKLVDNLPPPPQDPLRLVIGRVVIRDATVILRPGLPGLDREIVVPVATFELKNVGSGEGTPHGATVRDVIMQLVTALSANASESPAMPPKLRALIRLDLPALVDTLGAEARRQIDRALPGAMGRLLSGFFEPGALREGRIFSNPFVRSSTKPSTRPTTRPVGGVRDLLPRLGGARKPDTRADTDPQ
jgi:hypothetical protein